MTKKRKKPQSAFAKWFDAQYPVDRTGPYDREEESRLCEMVRQGRNAQAELRRRNKRVEEYTVAVNAWNAAKDPHPKAWTRKL